MKQSTICVDIWGYQVGLRIRIPTTIGHVSNADRELKSAVKGWFGEPID